MPTLFWFKPTFSYIKTHIFQEPQPYLSTALFISLAYNFYCISAHSCLSLSAVVVDMKYGEITHFSHPQHKLKFEYIEVPFKCDGCKEVGIGSRFKCTLCDYDLHKHCALSTTTSVINHPFYNKCTFQFLPRPPGNIPRYCNACEKDVNGFVYHCRKCGFDLHPCCANLPYTLEAGDMRLYLYRKVCAPCHRCGRKGRSWSYRSSIRGAGLNHHRSKGKVKRCCEIAALAVQFIISAILGDPTAIIAGVIGSFISRFHDSVNSNSFILSTLIMRLYCPKYRLDDARTCLRHNFSQITILYKPVLWHE